MMSRSEDNSWDTHKEKQENLGLIHTKVSSPREEEGERTEGEGLRNTCISRTKRGGVGNRKGRTTKKENSRESR